MADRSPPPLSSDARALLRAFRDHQSPTSLDRRRGLISVRARVDAAPADSGRFYARVVGVTVLLAAAVLLALKVVGAGVTALADRAREPAMEAPYQGGVTSGGGKAVERTVATPPRQRTGPPEQRAVVVEPEPEPAPSAPPPVHRASVERPSAAAPTAPAPATPAADLQAELVVIKRARRAMQDGTPAEGLAAVAEHERRFSQGMMVSERRVLKAELLCAAGRANEARALVKRFLAREPRSALADRMSAVCNEQGG